MYNRAAQQSPVPTPGPSIQLLNRRLGIRSNALATCGVITDAPDPSNGELTSSAPIVCSADQICAVETNLSIRGCAPNTADLSYTACLDQASSATSMGVNTVWCGENNAPYCNTILYNDGYSAVLCMATSPDATRHAVAPSTVPPNSAQTTNASSNAEAGAGAGSDSGPTTTIAIAVAVPLSALTLVVAIAIWFFKFRRPRHSAKANSHTDAEPVIHRLPRPDGGAPPSTMTHEPAPWLKPQMYDWDSSSRHSASTLGNDDSEPPRPLPQRERMLAPAISKNVPRRSWARTDIASTSAGTPNLPCPPRF